MIQQRWYEFGNTFGMRYLFEERGDGLAMHRHDPSDEHNVIVLKGSIHVSSRGWDGIEVSAPMIINVLPEWHEIVALEPGTELLNIYKNGKPASFDALPEHEKVTRFETRPLEHPII